MMAALHNITLPGWAIRSTGQVAAWCPWCGDLHMHGERGAVIGDVLDRAAHCTNSASPAYHGGYDVRVVGIVDHVRDVAPAPLALEPGQVPLAERLLSGTTFGGWGLRLPVLRLLFTNGRLSTNQIQGFAFTPRGLEVGVQPSGSWWVRQRQRAGWKTLGQGRCILALIELLFAWPPGWAAVHLLRACGAVLSPEVAARVAEAIEAGGAIAGDEASPAHPSHAAAPAMAAAAPPVEAALASGVSGDDIRLLAAFAQHVGPRVIAGAAELHEEGPAVAELATACARVVGFLTEDRADRIAALLDAEATTAERHAEVLDLAKERRRRALAQGDDTAPPAA